MKITTHFTGVISTGQFENEKPLFALEEETKGTDLEIQARTFELYQMCRTMFERAEKDSLAKKIKKLREDIRIREKNEIQYPSVTSIISWDFIADDHIKALACRGSIIHNQINDYWKNGKWREAREIPECYDDIMVLRILNDKLKMEIAYDDTNFLNFIEKYPIEFISGEQTVWNDEIIYYGTPDLKGIPKGKEWEKLGVKEVITLFDYKTGKFDEWRHFKQGTAYWHCRGNEDVKQFIIIPLTNETQQGFSKPKPLFDKEKFWDAFIKDRNRFKQTFGL